MGFFARQMEFSDKWAAIVWMCRNQLGRRNLTDVQRTLLIGEAYRAQKMTQGAADGFRGNQYEKVVKHQNGVLPKDTSTAKVVAKEFCVGSSTVDRANRFLEGLDAAESVSVGFKDAVRSGAIKAPQFVVQEIRNVPEAQLPAAVEAIKSGDISTAKEIIQQSKPEPPKKEAPPCASSSRALSCPQIKDKNKWAILTHLFLYHLVKGGGVFPYPSPCPSEAAGAPLSRSIISVIARFIKP